MKKRYTRNSDFLADQNDCRNSQKPEHLERKKDRHGKARNIAGEKEDRDQNEAEDDPDHFNE